MDNLENKQVLPIETQISDELSDDELNLVSGGRKYDGRPAHRRGESAGDRAGDRIKNKISYAVGFVRGFVD